MRFSALALLAFGCASAQVKFPQPTVVEIDGKPFTEFHKGDEINKPYLAPLRSASGKIVTRRFPMEKVPGESVDHLHHTGLWFSYDDVNGVKLWENHPTYKKGLIGREVVRDLKVKEGDGKLAADIDWNDPDGKTLLRESREMRFSGDSKLRTIDFLITLTAAQDVTFGDTKEGAFAIRLNDAFTEKRGCKITNAEGLAGMKNVWGKRSNWVDYVTDLDGEKLGVAMFDHPDNPRHPTYWHARDYGLFALNPFGRHAFDNDQEEWHFRLAKGDHLTFRWRVTIHPANTDVAAIYKEFAATK